VPFELCSKGLVLLKAIRECLRGSLHAHCFSLRAGIAYADAYAGICTPGFCLREVLIATLLLKMNRDEQGFLDVAHLSIK
jgi:hypothetical protein